MASPCEIHSGPKKKSRVERPETPRMDSESSAAELSDALMSGRAARKRAGRRGGPSAASSSFDPRLPAASAWGERGAARIDDEELGMMVNEILELNEVEWTGAAGRFN